MPEPVHTANPAATYVPLKAAHHLTLLLLAQEPTYGVELLDRLEARSNGGIRLNAGSLYRMIAQLVADGLVEPIEERANPGGVGAPRKLYGVTALGRAALRAEAERQAGLLELARDLDLLGGKR
jgi:DNA-binding PadR family transcriptional regulator